MRELSQMELWKLNQSKQFFDMDRRQVSTITYSTRILFGFGAVDMLAGEIAAMAIDRPLFVTDMPLLGTPVGKVVDRLASGLPLYSDTPENPTEAHVRAAARMYADNECNGIVAIGGGSPMDLAKAAALLATHHGPLADYALANDGQDRISSNVPPVIAVPTTAGTGSEVARATVIITEGGQKLPIGSPHLIPALAVCDPELTLSLPPRLTAATGFDAIAHCVECFCSPRINPAAEAIALDGLQRAVTYIETAVCNGSDREARWQMLMASLEGGLSFQKGLGGVHALAHPLGEYGLHHGMVNAVLLPHVLRHNWTAIRSKGERLAQALSLDDAQDLPDYFRDLTARLGLPTTLSEMGLPETVLEEIASKAELDSCNVTNPPPLDRAAYLDILRRAY